MRLTADRCALCGEPIALLRDVVSPGEYPWGLPGFRRGDGSTAHRRCANEAVSDFARLALDEELDFDGRAD